MSDETMRLVPDDVLERLDDMMCNCKADGSVLLSESVANEHGEDLQALLNAYRALSTPSTRDEVGPVAGEGGEPAAWERRWSRLREVKTMEHTPKGWTLYAVTKTKLLPDDFPLYAAPPAPQDDALRIAVEALMKLPELARWQAQLSKGIGTATKDGKVVLAVLAALKSTAGQGGDEDDPHAACRLCAEEHPEGVLEDDLCPACCDEEEDDR